MLSFYTSPPPPTSTLFPYTTLFRSHLLHHLPELDDLDRPADVALVLLARPDAQRLAEGAEQVRHRHRPRKERSEEHTSEVQSRLHLVCRLLLEKKKTKQNGHSTNVP